MSIVAIPGSIVKAICAVQATLESVKKSQRNNHGGYMFASTDDIYAAITRKMGEAGLVCMGLEDNEPEIKQVEKDGKTSQWMKIAYTFVLATEEATWTDPKSRRTLYIQITGPQTFQAAQSYAEKSYLRSLFKIPTGDMDLDSLPENYEYAPISFKARSNGKANGETVVAEPSTSDVPPPAPEEDAISEIADGCNQDDNRDFLAQVGDLLSLADTEDDLHEAWAAQMERICALPTIDRARADELFEKHLSRIEEAANASGH